MAEGLDYRLRITADGSMFVGAVKLATNWWNQFGSAADAAKGKTQQAGNATGKAGQQIKQSGDDVARATKQYDGLSISMGGLITRALTAIGTFATMRKGISFNAQLESATVGMAAMISAQNQIRDNQGQLLSGVDSFNAALAISQKQLQLLQREGVQTTAEFSDLVRVFSGILAPAQDAGLSIDQARKLTISMTQTANALGVNMQMVEQEVRAILNGTIQQEHRLKNGLGITNDMVREWRAAGTLMEELTRRTQMFSVAGQVAAKTWTGMVAGLGEVGSQFAGGIMSGMQEEIRRAGNAIFENFFDLDSMKINDKLLPLISGLNAALAGVGSVIGGAMEGLLTGAMALSEWIGKNADTLSNIGDIIGNIWTSITGIAGVAAQAAIAIAQWAVESGALEAALVVIAGALSTILEIVTDTVGFFTDTNTEALTLHATVGLLLIGYEALIVAQKIYNAQSAVGFAASIKNVGVLRSAAGLLGAALVGWNIGTYLKEQFLVVEFAGINLVQNLINGWERTKYAVELVWTAIEVAVSNSISSIKFLFGEFIQGAANALDHLPGMGNAASSMRAYGEALAQASKDQRSFTEEKKRLDEELNKTLSANNAIFEDMRVAAIAQHQMRDATKENASAQEELNKKTEEYSLKARAATLSTTALKNASKAAKEEQKRFAEELARAGREYEFGMKNLWEMLDALEATRDGLKKEVAQLEERNRLYGLSKIEIIDLSIAQTEAALAEERANDVTTQRLILLEDTLALLKEQRELTSQLEIKEAYTKQLQDVAEEGKRTAETIQQSLTDALMRGFEDGKGFAKNLRDTFKNLFKTLILQPLIQPIVTSASGTIMGMIPGASGAGGVAAGGGGGGMGGVMQIGQSIMGMFGGGGGTSGWMSSILGFFGGGGGGGTGGGMMGMFGGGGGGMGGVMGGAGMGYGIGSLIGSLGIGHGSHGGSLGSIGGAIGTIWGPIGTVIGSLIGGLIGSLIGRKGGDKTGASAMSEGIEGRYYTPNQQDDVARETITDIEESWAQIAQSLGVSGANIGFGIGWDADPKGDAQSRVSGGVYMDGQRVYFNQENLGRDAEKFEEGMALEIQRMLLAAAREVTEGDIKAILGDFDIADATLEEVQQAFADAEYWQRAVEPLRGVIEATLGQAFDFAAIDELARGGETLEATMTRLTTVFSATTTAARLVGQSVDDLFGAGLAGTDAREALASRFGGADAMAEAMSYYMQAFRPDEMTLQVFEESGAAIRSMFENLNMSVPRSRDEFDALIRGIDLTTESGQELFTSLMQLAPAFNNFVGALDDMSAAMSNTIADLRRSVEYDGLSEDERYRKLKAEADEAYIAFQSATDPVEMQRQFDIITRNMGEAWSMLSDEQKNAMRAEYLAKLDELEAEKNERIDAIKDTYLGVEDATRNIATAGNVLAQAVLDVAGQLGVDIPNITIADVEPQDVDFQTIAGDLSDVLSGEMSRAMRDTFDGLSDTLKPLLLDDSDPDAAFIAAHDFLTEMQDQQAESSAEMRDAVRGAGDDFNAGIASGARTMEDSFNRVVSGANRVAQYFDAVTDKPLVIDIKSNNNSAPVVVPMDSQLT